MCTTCNSTHYMIPFTLTIRSGVPIFEQVVYAATKAIVSGQLRPGDAFPSVRLLSRELKINPNTAHKVVAHLITSGLIEPQPGIGTVVAELPEATQRERTHLLEDAVEKLVVEAKRLGVEEAELISCMSGAWQRLDAAHMQQAAGTSTLAGKGDTK